MSWDKEYIDIGKRRDYEFNLVNKNEVILSVEPSCISCGFPEYSTNKIVGRMELVRKNFVKELILKVLVKGEDGLIRLDKLKVKANSYD